MCDFLVISCSLQDAIHHEHGRDFMGARIVVEWARGPKVHVYIIIYNNMYLCCF